MVQKTVNAFQVPGVPGDFFDNSPRRVLSKIADGAVTVGNAVSLADASNDPALVEVGGTSFAGIVVNGKELTHAGLTATLSVADGAVVPVCTMGRVWVKVAGAVTVAYLPTYNTTTGEISGVASGSAPSGYALIPNARFVAVNSAAGQLAVLELN